MSHESVVRNEVARHGWKIKRERTEIGVVGIPCYTALGVAGTCGIWVGIEPDSSILRASNEWQHGIAPHAAQVRHLPQGKLYDRSGAEFTTGLAKQFPTSCVLSFKPTDRDYEDAWEALTRYIGVVLSLFLGPSMPSGELTPRPFKFQITRRPDTRSSGVEEYSCG